VAANRHNYFLQIDPGTHQGGTNMYGRVLGFAVGQSHSLEVEGLSQRGRAYDGLARSRGINLAVGPERLCGQDMDGRLHSRTVEEVCREVKTGRRGLESVVVLLSGVLDGNGIEVAFDWRVWVELDEDDDKA
jgi:hypothetical protein